MPGTGVHGSFYSYRDVYLDLDPLYKDRFGRPLMRMTIDFHDNEIKQNAYLTDKFAEIIKAMGAKEVVKEPRPDTAATSASTSPSSASPQATTRSRSSTTRVRVAVALARYRTP